MPPSLGDWANRPPWSHTKRILYIDAYDSFSYNVVAMLEENLDVQVTIMTIDSEWPGDMIQFLQHYEAVVLGPGPGNPTTAEDVGIMKDIWNLPHGDLLPVFGICLGFQSLCLHHGIPIGRLPYPLHGQVLPVSTTGRDIFEDNHRHGLEVTLYHSLYAKLGASSCSSNDLELLAWLFVDNEVIPMGVRHKEKPFWGVQFHPESCKSSRESCTRLLKRWWKMALQVNKVAGRETNSYLHHVVEREKIPQELTIGTSGIKTPANEDTAVCDATMRECLRPQSVMNTTMSTESEYSTELAESITQLILKAQLNDDFSKEKLKEVKDLMHDSKNSSWGKSLHGLLQYKGTTYVPERAAIREKIVRLNHYDPQGGHRDLKRTIEAVLSKYFWKDIKEDVEKYVSGCSECLHVSDLSHTEIAFTMLDWSRSTSDNAGYRSFLPNNLTAERICERLNNPRSPAVLFQANGRHSIISVPSPGSWRLEYYAQSGKILLRKLSAQCGTSENQDNDERVVGGMLSVPRFWDILRDLMERKRVRSGNHAVPFWGGFLGYFSYEMGLASLAHPKATEDYFHNGHSYKSNSHESEDPPDVSLLWSERNVIVDNKTGQVTIQSILKGDDSQTGWIDQTLQQLGDLSDTSKPAHWQVDMNAEPLDLILKRSDIRFPNEQRYKEQVEACKDKLEAGESYELCLTCETSITVPSRAKPHHRCTFPWELYRRLKKYNPAAFSAYAKLGNVKIVSSSPECFLTWDRHSTLEMKPMKGTVRKSGDMTMEKAKEILSSTKEMAENLMIADLIRHDLYGICGSGGVRVEKLLEVEDHGRVFQMITHVKGEIDRNRRGFAVRDMPELKTSNMAIHGLTALQKCLPPGSMTGAPKERSCMHLQSIEGRRRGIYSGVMGYLDLGGGGNFSVLIRTAFTCSNDDDEKQLWRIGAGGAVTTLSTAEGEWEEMLTKLRTVCSIFTPLDSRNA
ncbi:Para-aminobenzoate synthase [Aspergillus sclerotialis]|uniref:aminodeoxychorismate synthase n=1 Tax=Aspergillus sclerotialis TaxID=2070753 RepID=A0A3A2ZN67_9EURO|nr:Para-aminobenzoate synthase [Aspergillus sclerotialis]